MALIMYTVVYIIYLMSNATKGETMDAQQLNTERMGLKDSFTTENGHVVYLENFRDDEPGHPGKEFPIHVELSANVVWVVIVRVTSEPSHSVKSWGLMTSSAFLYQADSEGGVVNLGAEFDCVGGEWLEEIQDQLQDYLTSQYSYEDMEAIRTGCNREEAYERKLTERAIRGGS